MEMSKTDKEFVESVRRWRNNESLPVAYISGKVIHQFHDMSEGYTPLYKQTDQNKRLHSGPL